jgi:hypothetical protein
MIQIIDTMRHQDAVYWEPVVDNLGNPMYDRYNNPLYLSPRQLTDKVFWIKQDELITDAKGQQKVSKARVFTGQDLKVDGVLLEGTIAQIPAGMSGSPMSIPDVAQIMRFDKIPTLGGDQFVRTAYL